VQALWRDRLGGYGTENGRAHRKLTIRLTLPIFGARSSQREGRDKEAAMNERDEQMTRIHRRALSSPSQSPMKTSASLERRLSRRLRRRYALARACRGQAHARRRFPHAAASFTTRERPSDVKQASAAALLSFTAKPIKPGAAVPVDHPAGKCATL